VTRRTIAQLEEKAYYPPRGYRISYFLVMSKVPTKGLREAADEHDIILVDLTDLF